MGHEGAKGDGGGLLFLALEAGCMGVLTFSALEVYTFQMFVLFSVYAVVQ